MNRLEPVDPTTATGKTAELFSAVAKRMGKVPNMMRVLANSPAALEGYLAFGSGLSGGKLSGRVREQIALLSAERNACDYCLAAHTALGSLQGLTPEEIRASRAGISADPKTAALLGFAGEILDGRGEVDQGALGRMAAAGWTPAEIAETVAAVALNVFTNYFNRVARTEIDFPAAEPLEAGNARQGPRAPSAAGAKA